VSKQYPECPLYNHDNCRELHSPKLCAIVRKDKTCLRELPKNVKKVKAHKYLILDKGFQGENVDSLASQKVRKEG
jgi:hypothetical protein